MITQYIFLTLGGVALLVCIFFTIHTVRLVRKWVKVKGTIIDLAYLRFRGYAYYPIIEFHTLNGEKITFRSNVGSNPSRHKKGEQIEVIYNPDFPQKAKVKSLFLWFGTFLSGTFALVYGVVGIVLMIIQHK